jgi:hypothetical protein
MEAESTQAGCAQMTSVVRFSVHELTASAPGRLSAPRVTAHDDDPAGGVGRASDGRTLSACPPALAWGLWRGDSTSVASSRSEASSPVIKTALLAKFVIQWPSSHWEGTVRDRGTIQHVSYSRWTLGEVLFRRFPWVLPCSPEQVARVTVPMFPTDATTVWRSVNGTIHSSHHL